MASPRIPTAERPSRRVIRWVVGLLLLTGLLYVVISPRLAERFVFIPDAGDPGPVPALAGVEGRDVKLTTADDVAVHGWWWSADPAAPAVVFFHGNAGNLGIRTPTARALVARGLSVFVLSYRGYARSEGSPSETGVIRDGAAALEWVAREVGGRDRVVLHGRSLGGFVALGVASSSEPAVAGVVVESSFTTLEEMAREVYPFLPSFLFRRLRGHFDNVAAASSLEAPLLVIHGAADGMIPPRMGERLYRAAPEARGWLQVSGAGHNDVPLVGGAEYWDRVAAFVRECVEGPRGEPPEIG